MSLRIATTQPAGSTDPRHNGRTARELMRQAATAGVRLIHLPEGFLSGYAKEQVADWADVDWTTVRGELAATADLATELGMWVVIGSAHPLTPPHRPHNSLYVISDRGEIVTRYDKRFCSNTEITRFYSPGFEPIVFEVDGYKFGCLICIEVNFPQLFAEYDRLGVDCVLLSAWPVDKIFYRKAQALAAIHNYWLSLSVPHQSAGLMPSTIFGPDGSEPATITAGNELAIVTLDRTAPEFHIPIDLARPWRAEANRGDIYRTRQVDDPRSTDRTRI
ncbi:carbon-nitrogen hydrolase family protein [Paractinoplanes durhamensis]|uniref:Amidohydrolase n=1 Tax=Paractinoplanes durhamensis TaxID=113563 RepID=A0ABQ3Z2Z1_9ACTN|nr:carbon-nitrogen hydrolase family protein [Actinoplanes durhamensis]GIE04165.1 amidohydrolase [Actinoplanes durhamensis]